MSKPDRLSAKAVALWGLVMATNVGAADFHYWVEDGSSDPSMMDPPSVGAVSTNTESTPYDGSGSGFQHILNWVFEGGVGAPGGTGNKVFLHIKQGVFTMAPVVMHGTVFQENVEITGAGMFATTLVMENNAGGTTENDTMISVANPLFSVKIAELTLDCNWDGQNEHKMSPANPLPYRAMGMNLAAEYITVHDVRVTNWGGYRPAWLSHGIKTGVEAFGISVNTASVGQVGPAILVEGCVVEEFHAENYAYSTGIITSTHNSIDETSTGGTNPPNYAPDLPSCQSAGAQLFLPQGSSTGRAQYPIGCRRSYLALIRNNVVVGNHLYQGPTDINDSIGYGAAKSEAVSFYQNHAVYCKAGFNADTGPISTIALALNRFEHVQMGIELGSPTAALNQQFDHINITQNEILLNGEPFFHSTDGPGISGSITGFCWGAACGIRLKGACDVGRITYNEVYAVPKADWNFVTWPSSRLVAPPPSEAYYIPLISHEGNIDAAGEKMFGHCFGDIFVSPSNTNTGLTSAKVYGNTTSQVPNATSPNVPFPALGGDWDANGPILDPYSLSGTDDVFVP